MYICIHTSESQKIPPPAPPPPPPQQQRIHCQTNLPNRPEQLLDLKDRCSSKFLVKDFLLLFTQKKTMETQQESINPTKKKAGLQIQYLWLKFFLELCGFVFFFRKASVKSEERHKTETAPIPNLHVPHKGQ